MVHIEFRNIGGFNNFIGTIDRTHIILETAPLKQPEIYWNCKKRYSIQCQGYDYLLEDSAYPLSSFLIKPFNNPVTDLQTCFNITQAVYD
ncbi:hypothetical protein RclHR1_17920004 [Rhizophagus clarus]|uniref:DDE Tnp4 domain-containing protein n=1 Tax=Rhizophagus clarus TaxID=94130 RepID=A0A2Z6QQ84_9GLOM|nr:hypothetical protein RclHR1_17920004 [Rhizophagus clarus]GES94267.1 hypothetical protein RCL_jg14080.t1 [Rhizophagus clarus]